MRTTLMITALGVLTLCTTGTAQAQHAGGGTANVAAGAVLEDSSTGLLHNVRLSAGESPNPGVGGALLHLTGGGLQLCTVNAGGPLVLGQPVPTPNCGNSGSQVVRVDKCTATFVAHGSTHIDYPHTPYVGSVTIEARLTKTAKGTSDADLEVTVIAPAGKTHLKGSVTGNVFISTCPF